MATVMIVIEHSTIVAMLLEYAFGGLTALRMQAPQRSGLHVRVPNRGAWMCNPTWTFMDIIE